SKKINTKSTKMKNFGGKGEVLLFESHLILYSSSEDKLGNFCFVQKFVDKSLLNEYTFIKVSSSFWSAVAYYRFEQSASKLSPSKAKAGFRTPHFERKVCEQ
ncbi:MAG: hypothetical protein AB1567_12190, partial [bacterium]